MISINNTSTSRELRLLAKGIDEGEELTFALCVIRGDDIKTAYRAEQPFELVGSMSYLKQKIIDNAID